MKKELMFTLRIALLLILLYYSFPLYLYYCVPYSGMGILMLFAFLFPIVIIIISLWYGYRIGIQLLYIVLCGALFIPMIFILNSSAAIYILFYMIAGAIGSIAGNLIQKARHHTF